MIGKRRFIAPASSSKKIESVFQETEPEKIKTNGMNLNAGDQ